MIKTAYNTGSETVRYTLKDTKRMAREIQIATKTFKYTLV